jgi:hypothetical protein
LSSDGGYADKVLAEQAHMRNVADGRSVPHTAANTPPPRGATPRCGPASARAVMQPAAALGTGASSNAEQVALLR